jgi:hypothetical protein
VYQVFAKRAGWQPDGTIDRVDRRRARLYAVGCLVSRRDAGALAAALERVIDGDADSGELGRRELVALVSFLRRGPILIR